MRQAEVTKIPCSQDLHPWGDDPKNGKIIITVEVFHKETGVWAPIGVQSLGVLNLEDKILQHLVLKASRACINKSQSVGRKQKLSS